MYLHLIESEDTAIDLVLSTEDDAYSKWFRNVETKKRSTRQAAAAQIVGESNELNTRWNFFEQWVTVLRKKQQERSKARLTAALQEAAEKAQSEAQAREALNKAQEEAHLRRVKPGEAEHQALSIRIRD